MSQQPSLNSVLQLRLDTETHRRLNDMLKDKKSQELRKLLKAYLEQHQQPELAAEANLKQQFSPALIERYKQRALKEKVSTVSLIEHVLEKIATKLCFFKGSDPFSSINNRW